MDRGAIEGHTGNELNDVLAFLYSRKRTGRLLVSAWGKKGEVFLEEGMLVHAQVGECMGIQAIVFMLSTAAMDLIPRST